ncbi:MULTISPECIES: outer membrane lipoprotein carrier protein LolA [unclassified Spirosoma]|uniref:LolA family protein n=1 Tax=unclassified Spirosoma TaxID=2621999 RepID=UPI000967223C|nr:MULTISPECIES: outer membrane lipoprotein carrier protein LolA [unclassified Spirosoma]MBN8825436.1 outer membrane lipoprotein carrier protein LolA [Spirosoma sp.]OJW74947.1 MAG: cell envelope biogenesis protein LolA [Spirosoma sp. 48-14]
MNKIALLLSVAILTVSPAFAQKDKRAQGILDAMSKRYKSLKSYQATFTYTSAGGGSKESYKGDLTVKNEKFHLILGGQEVFTDGKTMSTYIKETNEVNVQDYDASGGGELNPTQIYTIYKRGFDYRFLKEQKEGGRTLEVIELTPNRPKSPIATIQISVDKADKSVRNWLITNKDGKRTTYNITKFTPNVNVPDSYFVFDKAKYPGVEVVDLR